MNTDSSRPWRSRAVPGDLVGDAFEYLLGLVEDVYAVPAIPKIIAEGCYELVKTPDHAETTWHVLVGGRRSGLMRPTWRREWSRCG